MAMVTAGQFALTAAAFRGEWWRLWTGHFVHYDAAHLTTNAVALLVPLAVTGQGIRRRLLIAVLIIAPLLSTLLLAFANFDEYRGASGLAMALWVGGALMLARAGIASDRTTGYALLVIAAAKLAAEFAGTGYVWEALPPLRLAHVAGSLIGILIAVTDRSLVQLPARPIVEGIGPGAPAAAPPAHNVRRYCAGTYVGSEVVLSITEPYAVTRPVPEIT